MPAAGEWKGTWPTFAIGTDFQKWQVCRALIHAMHERDQIFGTRYFPRTNIVWSEGVIGSMTTTTLTDAARTPVNLGYDEFGVPIPNPLRWTVNTWYDHPVPGSGTGAFVPRFYDVIIYADAFDEPWKIVRAFIYGNSADTLTFRDVGLDSSDLSEFVGKRYAIIKQYGLWWHERIPKWPNQPTYIQATPLTSTTGGATTVATFTPAGGGGGTITFTIKLPTGVTADWKVFDSGGAVLYSGATTTAAVSYFNAAAGAGDVGRAVGYTYRNLANRIIDNTQSWTAGQWVGKHVAFKVRGRDRNASITANDAISLTFDGSYTADFPTAYAIFTTTGAAYYTIGHVPEYLLMWTGSPQDFRWSHTIDDQVWGAGGVALQSVSWTSESETGDFSTETKTIFDTNPDGSTNGEADLWSSIEESVSINPDAEGVAGGSDVCFTPRLYQAVLRGAQVWFETRYSRFVEKKDYAGDAALQVNNLTLAKAFSVAGVNSFTARVTAYTNPDGASPSLTIDLGSAPPYTPILFYYTIYAERDPVYDNLNDPNGYTGAYSVGSLAIKYDGVATATGRIVTLSGIGDASDVGSSVVCSWGWTRRVPLEVTHLQPRTWFMPGTNAGGNLQDPPTSDDPGTWATRAASTNYRMCDQLGAVGDTGPAIETSKKIRFVGDNYRDTTTDISVAGADPSVPYIDRGLFDGKRRDGRDLRGQLTGIATAGGGFFLTDASKNWLPWGIMRHDPDVGSGAATSGSATTLVDTSKSTDGRWDPSTGRWKNFIVTLTKPIPGHPTDPPQVAKVPITNYTGWPATPTLTFPACGITVDNTTTYTIEEPNNILNFWQGVKLKITKASDASVHTVTIAQNDGTTLFFAAGSVTVDAGDAYEILAPVFGSVYQWDGANWIAPAGWSVEDQKWGRPDVITRYGKAMKGDYETLTQVQEIQAAIIALAWVQVPMGWSSRSPSNFASNTPELNEKAFHRINAADDIDPTVEITYADNQYDTASTPVEHGGAAPAANWDASAQDAAGSFDILRRYAYGIFDNIAPVPLLASSAQLYLAADNDDTFAVTTIFSSGRILHDYTLFDQEGATIPSIIAYTLTAQTIGAFSETDVTFKKRRGLWATYTTLAPSLEAHRRAPTPFPSTSLARPHDPSPFPSSGDRTNNGYAVTRQVVIQKFDVSGGLTYI